MAFNGSGALPFRTSHYSGAVKDKRPGAKSGNVRSVARCETFLDSPAVAIVPKKANKTKEQEHDKKTRKHIQINQRSI